MWNIVYKEILKENKANEDYQNNILNKKNRKQNVEYKKIDHWKKKTESELSDYAKTMREKIFNGEY